MFHKRVTTGEVAVLAGTLMAALILLGLLGFGILLWRAPSDTEVAASLTRYSSISLGSGVAIGCGAWLVRRIMD